MVFSDPVRSYLQSKLHNQIITWYISPESNLRPLLEVKSNSLVLLLIPYSQLVQSNSSSIVSQSSVQAWFARTEVLFISSSSTGKGHLRLWCVLYRRFASFTHFAGCSTNSHTSQSWSYDSRITTCPFRGRFYALYHPFGVTFVKESVKEPLIHPY